MIGIKMENAASFKNMAAKLTAIVAEEVDAMAKEVGKDYVDMLKASSPVDMDGDDPGKLRRSWSGETERVGRNGRAAVAENDCEYTPYVEYGHRKVTRSGRVIGWQRGRFFVKKSSNKIRKSLPKRYEEMGARIERRLGE